MVEGPRNVPAIDARGFVAFAVLALPLKLALCVRPFLHHSGVQQSARATWVSMQAWAPRILRGPMLSCTHADDEVVTLALVAVVGDLDLDEDSDGGDDAA